LRGLLALPRAIHELIWGLILVNIWGTESITGIVAIALPFGLITGKVFAEILDDSPRLAWRSLLDSGANPWAALVYGLLPQANLNLLSYAFYRFECSLRSAAVLGMIGVGGLGTEIQLSLQSLRYEQLWTFFYALVLLNGSIDFASARTRRQWGCATRLDINVRSSPVAAISQAKKTSHLDNFTQTKQIAQTDQTARTQNPVRDRTPAPPPEQTALPSPSPLTPSPHASPLPWLLVAGLIAFCFWQLQPNLERATSARSFGLAQEFLSQALPPDWSLLPQLPWLALQTLAMSVVAIALASFGGTLLAFLSARTIVLPGGLLNPQQRDLKGAQLALAWGLLLGSRGLLLFARAIPSPVWALVLLYLLFPGILPGAIALGIHNLGILGRLQSEVIENLETPPLDSLAAQGAPPAMIFCYGVLPLTLPRFLAYGFYRWEVCLRETVIVGLVGAGGLGYLIREQVSGFDYAGLSATLLGFMVLTWVVDSLSGKARQALR
jgi:phosphonate transport system permease protein